MKKQNKNSKKPVHIRLLAGFLDEEKDGNIVLRGVLDLDSLSLLKVDSYQREHLQGASNVKIRNALSTGASLPDIELGMRGQRFEEKRDGTFVLLDDVYLVDGLQRTSEILEKVKGDPEFTYRLGAKIHFDTDKEWEKNHFKVLNADRTSVASTIHIRNERDNSPAVDMMVKMAEAAGWPLGGRICWDQKMSKAHLMTGKTMTDFVGALHGHLGYTKQTGMLLIPNLDKVCGIIGVPQMRANIITFAELLDECWSIADIKARKNAPHVRLGFVRTLASFLSDHKDFWRGEHGDHELFIEAPLRRKLAQFGVTDPYIQGLMGGRKDILYAVIRDHVNSGKRTKRLQVRPKPNAAKEKD